MQVRNYSLFARARRIGGREDAEAVAKASIADIYVQRALVSSAPIGGGDRGTSNARTAKWISWFAGSRLRKETAIRFPVPFETLAFILEKKFLKAAQAALDKLPDLVLRSSRK